MSDEDLIADLKSRGADITALSALARADDKSLQEMLKALGYSKLGERARATSALKATTMSSYSAEEIQSLAADNHCEDLLEEIQAMTLWSKEEVQKFFDSGGEIKPPPAKPPPDISDLKSDDGVLVAKKRGAAALSAGNLLGAVAAYREALDMCKSDKLLETHGAAIQSNLALVTLKLGDYDASLAAADKSISHKPDWHKAHFRKGEALFELKKFAESAAAYKEALRLSPGEADIQRNLAIAQDAEKGGLFLKQLLPGRDIANRTPASQQEGLIFGSASQMQNFIYLIGDQTKRECYAVDACWDPKGIADFAAAWKMKLVGSIASHYHFDHTGGLLPPQFHALVYGPFGKPPGGGEPFLPGLREMHTDHNCKLYCHALERERLAKQCQVEESVLTPLEHGGKLPLGSWGHIEVFHTPGHSGGSICLSVQKENSKPTALIVGDTIFPGSCGRLDLPDSDINAMFDSLQRLREFDDATAVYPGHAYSGPSTTIGKEKAEGLLRPFTREMWLRMQGQ